MRMPRFVRVRTRIKVKYLSTSAKCSHSKINFVRCIVASSPHHYPRKMSKIKISYFDIPALGEPIRLLLAYGGEQFEDNRINVDNWPKIKATTPFGQVPVYEENGKVASQSVAIMRYLGKKYKLNGANDWENLEIDAMGDTVMDFLMSIAKYHYEPSAKAKASKKEALYKETIPFYLKRLEDIAKLNNGHLATKKLTWADFCFAGIVKYLSLMGKIDIIENNANLRAVYENVMKLPAIKNWYEKHPYPKDGTIAWLESTGKPSKD